MLILVVGIYYDLSAENRQVPSYWYCLKTSTVVLYAIIVIMRNIPGLGDCVQV